MRISVHTDGPSPHLFPLFECWQDLGEDVHVLLEWRVGRFGGPEATRLQLDRMVWLRDHFCGSRRPWDALLRLRLLDDHVVRADVLVLGSYANLTALLLLRLAKRHGVPVVLHLERPSPAPSTLRRVLRDRVIRYFCGRAALVWTMSSAGQQAYTAHGAVLGARVPYPLDPTAWPAASPGELGTAPARAIRVIIVGSLIPRKQPMLALEIIRTLVGDGHVVEAQMVGTGPLATAVAEAAEGLPVRIRGAVAPIELRSLLLESDVLLHPASDDGWGMVVPEAIVSGCAVVATTGTDSAQELARLDGLTRITEPTVAEMAAAVLDVAARRTAIGLDGLASRAATVAQFLHPERLGTLSRDELRVTAAAKVPA
jgi:glycosyltransferase involved in cell wall biosynthesis